MQLWEKASILIQIQIGTRIGSKFLANFRIQIQIQHIWIYNTVLYGLYTHLRAFLILLHLPSISQASEINQSNTF